MARDMEKRRAYMRARYASNPQVRAKAKANSKRQAAKCKTSERHRDLRRAAKRRHRWKCGSLPLAKYRALKAAQRTERNAEAERLRAARQAFRDAHPRLSPTERCRLRYATDASFHGREYERLQEKKRRHRRQIAATAELSNHDTKRLRAEGESCCYCGTPLDADTRTLDHVVALSRGGRHNRSNLVHACLSCNSSKQHYSPIEWRPATRDVATA